MATYVPLTGLPHQYIDPVTQVPMVNGTMLFYLSGTSTPTNIFSDNAGTSLGTSVTLDSAGFPASGGNIVNLFRDSAINYKVVLKNAAGSILGTFDTLDFFTKIATAIAGTVGAPALTLGDGSAIDANTGWYHSAADVWRFAAAGTYILALSSVGISLSNLVRLYNGDGTVALPSIAFTTDDETGFYLVGANQLGVAVNATKTAEFNSSAFKSLLPVELPSYTVAGVPAATTAARLIYVSNESGGAVVAFSDGANWRRVTDRAIVS